MKQNQKLKNLRQSMQQKGIDLYLMVNSDPHESEYLPEYWKCITWLTGFRGEVATVIVTQNEALLWTDSRFFLSGDQQLADSGFQLMKMKVDIPVETWLNNYIKQSVNPPVIAGDKRVIFGKMADFITMDKDLISPLWEDRPTLPQGKIEIYPDAYNGVSAAEKIRRVLDCIHREDGKGALFLKALDEIAWVLNLRGSDIHCTPVFISYLLLSETRKVLFVDDAKLTQEVKMYLQNLGIETAPYEEAPLTAEKGLHYTTNNPIPLMKAIKNPVEIEGYRKAMLKDGIALTRFYHWLEDALKAGETITELDCVDKLIHYRSSFEDYREESFDAIVAWNEHGALPHYEPRPESNVTIQGDGLLLIDTGGQYLDGTTDITRTIGVGKVSDAMKRDYTLVLKGHIRLATAVFPKGTRGDQLDALARLDLWRDGKTYRHGTGHGVGHYLGCHEGPESIRMEHNPQILEEGMLFSNEPAIYLGGKYGVRHENCVLVRPFDVKNEAPDATPCDLSEHGEFLCLETLTLCYIDTSCIDRNLLTVDETNWINNYNRRVYELVSPYLEESDRIWLKQKCVNLI
ncbi:MAG: aminopeptidase P family protein [Bacteroidales bacterium]|nr:aminopeptidase P family protein [Bacteroidales bacterium]